MAVPSCLLSLTASLLPFGQSGLIESRSTPAAHSSFDGRALGALRRSGGFHAAAAGVECNQHIKQRKSRLIRNQAALQLVPRRGLEPPRSYPLVPETSASTNSATWAGTFYAEAARHENVVRFKRSLKL